MYKKDLALNDLQWLICHKTKQNQTKPNQTNTKPNQTNTKAILVEEQPWFYLIHDWQR